MRVIGIDPGATGAIALFTGDVLAEVADMPTVLVRRKARVDAAAVGALLRKLAPDHAFVEMTGAMPGQGVSSMFNFGLACGVVLGAIGALSIPITAVTAAQWKGSLRVPAAKDGARARASQLLPKAASLWPLSKHHGRAEAALIGYYGTRQGNGETVW
jgi:crossover junction endodeoxyribonuclease RuvC